jgi:hypothetical protein
MEVSEGERPRLRDVRIEEKESEWKREVRILTGLG